VAAKESPISVKGPGKRGARFLARGFDARLTRGAGRDECEFISAPVFPPFEREWDCARPDVRPIVAAA
jgi:hypothetical protein